MSAAENAAASLAGDLRKLREAAGQPSFRQMETRCNVSYGVLARVASGKDLPTWHAVQAFVKACGADPGDWLARWEVARDSVSHLSEQSEGWVDADSTAGVIDRLRRLKRERGDMSYRVIAGESGLPTSTVADAFNRGRAHPPSWEVIQRILTVLGVPSDDQEEWKASVRRAAAQLPPQRQAASAPATRLQRQGLELGLEGIYPTRADALKVFAGAIEYELERGANGLIWICGSSMKGLIQVAVGPFDGSELIRRAVKAGCDLRLLCTDPVNAEKRAEQENRMVGEIKREILLSLSYFKKNKVRRDKVKYHKNMPNVFALATSDRMILNPYPYGGEAFRDFTLIVYRTPNPDSIYDRYRRRHFEAAWKTAKEIPDEDWDQPEEHMPSNGR